MKQSQDKREEAFDSEFLKKLQQLEIVFRRARRGAREGERVTAQKGGRVEFADYRKYSSGDDFRYVDWNVYGRTDKLFVKQFAKEEELQVCLLLDKSESMSYGDPAKFGYARKFVLAMAYLGLVGKNTVRIAAFSEGQLEWSSWISDRARLYDLMDFLRPMRTGGRTDVAGALREFYEQVPKRCLVILTSDLMDETDVRRGLGLLANRGFDVCLFHLLSPQEVHPRLSGKLLLRDLETRRARQMIVRPETVQTYLDTLNACREEWRSFCLRHGMLYVHAETDVPLDELLLRYLREGGLLK